MFLFFQNSNSIHSKGSLVLIQFKCTVNGSFIQTETAIHCAFKLKKKCKQILYSWLSEVAPKSLWTLYLTKRKGFNKTIKNIFDRTKTKQTTSLVA